MSLAGEGALAIWHDIAPEGRDVFYAWHGEEHMPERVGIPGFLRGRRYAAIEGDLEFFNLYETLSPQVLTGTDYKSRVDNPTPWTRSAVTHFRNVARSICRVSATLGKGQGGLIATFRYDVPDEAAAEHEAALGRRLLPELAGRPGIAGAHLLLADIGASSTANAEERARAERNRVPGCVVLVEGWGDEAPFLATCREALSDDVLAGAGARGTVAFGAYRLQVSRAKTAWTAG